MEGTMRKLLHFLRRKHAWKPAVILAPDGDRWTALEMCARCPMFTRPWRKFSRVLVLDGYRLRAVSTINGDRP